MKTFIGHPPGWAGIDPDLQVHVVEVVDGEQLRIQIAGDLDRATAPVVHDHLRTTITTNGAAHVDVDLSGVGFCDVAAIRALSALAEAATRNGATFRLRGARAHIAWLCDHLDSGHLLSGEPGP